MSKAIIKNKAAESVPKSDQNDFHSDKKIHAQFFLQRPGFILDVDLHLPTHGVIAIFGPSGCGKTTLLRCMSGLEQTPNGHMSWRESQFSQAHIWQDETLFVPTHQRPLGYVFQEASLFDHLTVQGNLSYAIKRRKKNTESNTTLNDQAIMDLLGISHLLKRKPNNLSGGERQRVAIARALMIHPQILFMDEPLAAIDDARKDEVMPYLENLKQELSIPIIYVTHSTDEIARLADHLVVMENGEVTQSGKLNTVLSDIDHPLKLGSDMGAVLTGQIQEKDPEYHLMQVAFDGGSVWLRDSGHNMGDYVRIRLLAKDISLSLTQHNDSSIQNILSGQLIKLLYDQDNSMMLAQVAVGKSLLLARITKRAKVTLNLKPEMPIWLQIKSAALIS